MYRFNYFDRLQGIKNEDDFETLALEVFQYQFQNNEIYSEFVKSLNISPEKIKSIYEIPFLPVEIFKTRKVLTGNESYQRIFTSSGTTGDQASKHYVKDISLYEINFSKIFSLFYNSPSDYTILALLPSYLEREGSSLIYMTDKLIKATQSPGSGFYLDEYKKLFSILEQLKKEKRKTILFGVTYALLDFIFSFKINFPGLIIMETGGMKGKRKEMVREEVHELLCAGFGVEVVHSEYGMTELLSQAYSCGNGIFKSPAWMRILVRDPYDPIKPAALKTSGGINIIDLANIDSCAFVSTQDLGRVYPDHSFEVIGRFDFSDVRGCNLMID